MKEWAVENRDVLDRMKTYVCWANLDDEDFVFRSVHPTFRGANIQFAYLDDSIFIDFGRFSTGKLYLLRISFDGYGCCNMTSFRPLSLELSAILENQWQMSSCDMDVLWPAMKEVVVLNQDQLWKEAIEEYGLWRGR